MIAAAGALALVAACSPPVAPAPVAAASPPASPVIMETRSPATSRATTPAGCRATVAPGRSRQAIAVDGVRRSYLLDVPAQPDAGHARPALVVDLHGYGQSAAQQEAYTGLGTAGRAAGVVVATPDGVRGAWNFPRRSAIGPDDVRFLGALIAALERTACADPARVVLTGISDGADMADTAGCALTGIAAVVGVAPSVPVSPCAHRVPTLIEVHGTADPIVGYAGGGGDRPAPFQGTAAVAVTTRMDRWARLRGCPTTPAEHRVSASIAVSVWPCRERLLALYTVAGGGHTWPGATAMPALGATTAERSATAGVLAVAVRPTALPW